MADSITEATQLFHQHDIIQHGVDMAASSRNLKMCNVPSEQAVIRTSTLWGWDKGWPCWLALGARHIHAPESGAGLPKRASRLAAWLTPPSVPRRWLFQHTFGAGAV